MTHDKEKEKAYRAMDKVPGADPRPLHKTAAWKHYFGPKRKEVAKKMPSVASQIRARKKQERIIKLVKNAPEGSALRPWNYDKRKYE